MKERLTGAIILVALMVLLIPELLTGPVRSAPHPLALGPGTGEAPLRSYTIELSDEARARSGTSQASGPRPPAPLAGGSQPAGSTQTEAAARVSPDPPHAAPISTASAASPSAPTYAPTSAATEARAATLSAPGAATSEPGPWVVQLGSFASRVNAERLAQRVRSQGFQVSVSQSLSGRHLYRVRVGSAQTEAGALALAHKLRALGHSGRVLPKQGGA